MMIFENSYQKIAKKLRHRFTITTLQS